MVLGTFSFICLNLCIYMDFACTTEMRAQLVFRLHTIGIIVWCSKIQNCLVKVCHSLNV